MLDQFVRSLFLQVGYIIVFGSVYANCTSDDQLSSIDQAARSAFDLQKRGEESNDIKVDHLQNEQKNQGLINTLINHNNQLKNINNKFNFITNNFANSSHIKEIIEKTNDIEKHIVGAPQPHKSWREFLLVSIGLGVLVVGIIKVVRKFCLPWLSGYMNKQSREHSMEIATIGKQIDYHYDKPTFTLLELKNFMEHQLNQQNHQLDIISRKLNESPPTL